MNKLFLIVSAFLLVYFPTVNALDELKFTLSDRLYMCKSGFYGELDRIEELINILESEESTPSSYFAYKGNSRFGIGYILLVNYEKESKVLSLSTKSINVRSIDIEKAKELMNELMPDGYEDVRDSIKDNSYHDTCDFFRIYDSVNYYEFQLLNSQGEKGSIEAKIYGIVTDFFDNEINMYHFSCSQEKEQITVGSQRNSDFNEENYLKFMDKITNDLFFELTVFE